MRFLILTKVLIYSGCQMSASKTGITSITAATNKLIDNLGKLFTYFLPSGVFLQLSVNTALRRKQLALPQIEEIYCSSLDLAQL